MNKKLFIMFLLSLAIIVIICTISINFSNKEEHSPEITASTGEVNAEIQKENYAKLIRYNSKLYKYNAEYDYPTCGVLDSGVISVVPPNTIPRNDCEANFEGCIGIQTGDSTYITVEIDGKSYIFINVDESLSKEEILKDTTTYTNAPKTTERLIKIGDKFYRDTGKIVDCKQSRIIMESAEIYGDTGEIVDCKHIMGKRTSYSAMEGEIPQRDNETNFFGCYFYFFDGNDLKVEIDGHYYLFEEYEI